MEIVLAILSILLILAVFLSLVRNDFWIYKILEYPRLQKLLLIVPVLVGWLLVWPEEIFYRILFVLLVVSAFYLIYKIWPYTSFSRTEMLNAPADQPKNELKLFSANVLQENREYDRILQQIMATDPDLIFLLETNAEWCESLSQLAEIYPYKLLQPMENTYGLCFYSRFPFEKAQVNYLVKNDIPSIDVIIILPSGEKVQLWGLHPEPPVPNESLYSTAKDKELMKVALKVKECTLPCIVFGDLNDVAWSHTTELFRKTSRLLDPRRGRGFYSTFSAHHWLIRYPLDYIFCSDEFSLVRMKRMPKNGSDHFATFTHLILKREQAPKQEAPHADKQELNEAKEIAGKSV